jgi:hypothetical protein
MSIKRSSARKKNAENDEEVDEKERGMRNEE